MNDSEINIRFKRICVVGEWLNGQGDEGIHNLAQNLLDQWEIAYAVRSIKIGTDLSVNRLFLSWRLCKALREYCPDIIFYISPSSAKVIALFRAKVLKIYSSRSRVFIIATQPDGYSRFEKLLLPLLAPDGIFVQGPSSKLKLQHIPCPVDFLPSGVDTSRFVPVDEMQKKNLREKYEVDEDAFVVLHVGHINRDRNIQVLERVNRLGNIMVIIVGSTSTRQDEELAQQLAQAGVKLIREFVSHIEQIYQLADAYIFPVISEEAAIGVPLSVLEAMACNLPIITTRFGGLPWMFQGGGGFVYFDDENELPRLIGDIQMLQKSATRQMVSPYGWNKVAAGVIELIQMRNSSQ